MPTPAPRSPDLPAVGVVLLDLDGVVWLAHRPIPGSVEAVGRLRAAGSRVVFVTNNSAATIEQHEAALGAIGIEARGDVLSSATAAARLVQPGERVLVCGDVGIEQALERRGATVARAGAVDAVVVGFHRSFDYDGLCRAAAAVGRGARLIGANDDTTYPTPDGPIPGGGAILAAVRAAAGVTGEVAGKPYEAMAELVCELVGAPAAAAGVMVGDRPSTDGLFARRLGCRFGLVLTGVTATAPDDPRPDLVGADLAHLVDGLLGPRQ